MTFWFPTNHFPCEMVFLKIWKCDKLSTYRECQKGTKNITKIKVERPKNIVIEIWCNISAKVKINVLESTQILTHSRFGYEFTRTLRYSIHFSYFTRLFEKFQLDATGISYTGKWYKNTFTANSYHTYWNTTENPPSARMDRTGLSRLPRKCKDM